MSAERSGKHPPTLVPTSPTAATVLKPVALASLRAARRLTRLILIFAIAYAVLILSPAFLTPAFGLYPLMKLGDATDVLTPLIVLPLYWVLFQVRKDVSTSVGESIGFMVLAAVWVEGQGMHLSANSIGHLLTPAVNGNAYVLAEFYDEVLSHYLWHIGMVGMTTLLLLRQWRHPFDAPTHPRSQFVASLIYGFTYFACVIEAQTATLGVPFAIALVVFGLVWGRREFRRQPVLAFFVGAQLVSLILFAIWGAYWGGLPEFSKVGIIN